MAIDIRDFYRSNQNLFARPGCRRVQLDGPGFDVAALTTASRIGTSPPLQYREPRDSWAPIRHVFSTTDGRRFMDMGRRSRPGPRHRLDPSRRGLVLVAGTNASGVFYSSDRGASWNEANSLRTWSCCLSASSEQCVRRDQKKAFSGHGSRTWGSWTASRQLACRTTRTLSESSRWPFECGTALLSPTCPTRRIPHPPTWVTHGLPLTRLYPIKSCVLCWRAEPMLLAGTHAGVFLSDGFRPFWTDVGTGLPKTEIFSLYLPVGTMCYAGTSGHGSGSGLWPI